MQKDQIKPMPPFRDKEYFEEVKKEFYETVVRYDQVKRAYGLLRNFEKFLKSESTFEKDSHELYVEYKNLLIHARFIALPLLKEAELIDLFTNHFAESFDINISLKEKFKSKLTTIIIYDERDQFRDKIGKALLANESVLIDGLVVNIHTNLHLKKVNEFLQDYIRFLGVERIDSVKRNNFLVKSYDIEHLSGETQKRLKVLFDFYEFLKASSWEWESGEEPFIISDKEGLKVVEGGRVERVENPNIEKTIKILEEMGFLPKGKEGVMREENIIRLKRIWADFESGELFREIEKVRRQEISNAQYPISNEEQKKMA